MEVPAPAKVHAKLNNVHARRTMSSALQNVIKMVQAAKIKDINNIQLILFLSSISLNYFRYFIFVKSDFFKKSINFKDDLSHRVENYMYSF